MTAESERRTRLYEAVLSTTRTSVVLDGLDHRFSYANEGLLRMWGKTWDEAIGKNCLELGYEPWHAAMHDREIERGRSRRSSRSAGRCRSRARSAGGSTTTSSCR